VTGARGEVITLNTATAWDRMWAKVPHIRFGDPCHDCAALLAPASRRWRSDTLPPGVRKHAGSGLCSSCAGVRDREQPGWRDALRNAS
jgi:hypothetical protein